MRRDTAHAWNAADTVTSVRMVCSLALLLPAYASAGFYALYTFAGLTDALDGWLARKTGTASDFGARLDSAADLLFYGVVLLRLFPVLREVLPGAIFIAVAGIVLVRLAAYSAAAVRYHRFTALHTPLNKLTGAAVFLLPYVLAVSSGAAYVWAICALAFAASLQELMLHLFRPGRRADG